MSGRAQQQPGPLFPDAALPVPRRVEATDGMDAVEPATAYTPGRRWVEVPAENLFAWNAYRLTGYAILVLKTHVPDRPTPVARLDARMPAPELPAPRCTGCPQSPPWPCRHVDWACDWIERLPHMVEVVDHRTGFVDGVSRPVAVGDVHIPAVTWDTPSRGTEVG